MNTLKPLLICAVLAGIGYGVYVRINSGDDTPPPGAPQNWDAPPDVQLGNPAAADTAMAPGGNEAWPGEAGAPSAAPPFASLQQSAPVGEAQPFGTPPAGPTPGSDAVAPPYDSGAMPTPSAGVQPPTDTAQANPYGNPAGLAPPVNTAEVPVPDRYRTPEDAAADRYATPDAGTDDPYAVPNGNVPDRYRTQDTGTPDQYGTPDGGNPPPQQTEPEGTFVDAIDAAKRELEAGQMAGALASLSSWYGNPNLTPEEHQQLNQLLDQVAGTVVYSTQHLLEPPYEVQPGERLEDIATRYSIPWQLLAKINGIEDPNNLRPGERLKIVRGPFNAVVSLDKRELTLVLADGSYAGRFPIGIGRDQPPREGTFTVSDKVTDPVYRGRQQVVNSGDPANPLGHRWIGLGSDLGIHGTDRDENLGRTDLPGSISLSRRDIDDVFDILATGSKVTIRR